jgi:hypothetical protein
VGSASRIALGVPLYNGELYVEAALDSLLGQTYGSFEVVLVDDYSSDGTPDIARAFAAQDPRVHFIRNDRRLGLVGTWNRAFELAMSTVPEAEFFAWGSDHDVWHPRWLESLVAALDDRVEAVLAYPLRDCIDDAGRSIKAGPPRFDTVGMTDPGQRLQAAVRRMSAGNMIYGLFRACALPRPHPLPLAILPDKALIAVVALEGEVVQVPTTLWHRRYKPGERASIARQRRSFYPNGAPLTSYAPWAFSHFWIVLRRLKQIDRRAMPSRRVAAIACTFLLATLAINIRKSRVGRVWRKQTQRARSLRRRIFKKAVHSLKRRMRKIDNVDGRDTEARGRWRSTGIGSPSLTARPDQGRQEQGRQDARPR